jgi:hypothetical protein
VYCLSLLKRHLFFDASMEKAALSAGARSGHSGKPSLRVAHPPRFDLGCKESKNAFLNYLDEHGYAVVAAVADEAEVVAAKVRFWAAIDLNAEVVLNPASPNCDSLWWPDKRTGPIAAHIPSNVDSELVSNAVLDSMRRHHMLAFLQPQ